MFEAIKAFGFATATEIRFGRGVALAAVPEIASLGPRVLLLTGATPARADWLARALGAAGCALTPWAIPGEPDMAMIEAGVAEARRHGAQVVVAIGGGAVIDAGKAIAALVPATRPHLDHLEVVGQGLPLDHAPLPFVAIPTTAGTGAEVTRNAVISVPDQRRKVSLGLQPRQRRPRHALRKRQEVGPLAAAVVVLPVVGRRDAKLERRVAVHVELRREFLVHRRVHLLRTPQVTKMQHHRRCHCVPTHS